MDLSLLLGLLGEQDAVDVGKDTAGGDGDTAEQLAQLLVVADGQLDVTGHNAVLLVVAGSVASKLKHLGGEVLEDGSQVHGGASTDALGILALLEDPVVVVRVCRGVVDLVRVIFKFAGAVGPGFVFHGARAIPQPVTLSRKKLPPPLTFIFKTKIKSEGLTIFFL